ncbi:hypothetical protein [Herpetosiphon geysericola]|uniref:Uncharacterized protein n=1 Tax=Herpetosiphon geysericola TaxID=70996 RepID=A0A0P6XEE0_9CHLR|nr:hypothetical protein [Herpetosiphon geysericola]KPL81440.1 hypothetical protein SE18_22670 [Herpetosiphon geysericola]
MSQLSLDTSSKAEEIQINILRSMSIVEKLRLAEQLNQTRDRLAFYGLRKRFPDASNRELQRRFFDIKLGYELANKVYGSIEQWCNNEIIE